MYNQFVIYCIYWDIYIYIYIYIYMRRLTNAPPSFIFFFEYSKLCSECKSYLLLIYFIHVTKTLFGSTGSRKDVDLIGIKLHFESESLTVQMICLSEALAFFWGFLFYIHYENTPIQIYGKFHLQINLKISAKKLLYFSYFCSKHRLWVLVRIASARRF